MHVKGLVDSTKGLKLKAYTSYRCNETREHAHVVGGKSIDGWHTYIFETHMSRAPTDYEPCAADMLSSAHVMTNRFHLND